MPSVNWRCTSKYNPTTGKEYKGMNTLWLHAQGHGDPRWMTYNQAAGEGAQVRKGEKACPVIYYGSAPVRDGKAANDPDADGKTYRFLKLFHVFNVEQIDDLPPDFGGPLRMRVPRQLGYKSVKFVNRLTLAAAPTVVPSDYSWYAGI